MLLYFSSTNELHFLPSSWPRQICIHSNPPRYHAGYVARTNRPFFPATRKNALTNTNLDAESEVIFRLRSVECFAILRCVFVFKTLVDSTWRGMLCESLQTTRKTNWHFRGPGSAAAFWKVDRAGESISLNSRRVKDKGVTTSSLMMSEAAFDFANVSR